MKKLLKYCGVLFSVLFIVASLFVAFNFTYLERSLSFFKGDRVRDVDWFDPVTNITPSSIVEPLVSAQSISEQDMIFAEAIDYAESLNSSVLMAWQSGELILEKYWPEYDAQSDFQTNSVHKSVLSLLVGIAVSEAAIESVQDPVSKYLDSWIDQPYGAISIEHLLTMASGLGKEKSRLFIFDHSMRQMHASDISAVAQSLPQMSAPGEQFNYIGTNPQLLIDVLEAATGESYETYFQDKLWAKVAANPAMLWMDRKGGTPHGACCLISTAADLLRIGLLILNQGQVKAEQIVPSEWIQAATSPSKANPNYGYLIWRGSPYNAERTYDSKGLFRVPHSEPYLADDVLFFDGFGGQRVYIIPSRDLVIVRVGESRFDFDDSILPNRIMDVLSDKQRLEGLADYQVSHADVSIDTEHSGNIHLRLSYPVEGTSSQDRFPLIVFSHGSALTATAYHNLTDPWVKKGFVVVAPTHLEAGGDMEAGSAIREKYGSDWLTVSRVFDLSESINQIGLITQSLDGFKGSVFTDRVIAAGHSYGALTAQIMAGARLEELGNSLYPMPDLDRLKDERVVAVVAISPPGLVPGYLTEKTWNDFSEPQLVVTGTKDAQPPFWPEYQDHIVSYETAQQGDNYLLVLDGMDHYLGNLIGRPERTQAPQQQALNHIVDQSLLFMNSYLDPENDDTKKRLNDMAKIKGLPGIVRYERR